MSQKSAFADEATPASKPVQRKPIRKRFAKKKAAKRIHRPWSPWMMAEEDDILSLAVSIATIVSFGVRVYKTLSRKSK